MAQAAGDRVTLAASALEGALRAAIDAYLGIADAADRLRQAISVRDVQALSRAVDGERAALGAASVAEADLREAVSDLAVALAAPVTVSLPSLCGVLARRGDGRQATRLSAARTALAAAMERARQANAGNAVLLRQAIALTTLALRHLTAGSGDTHGYTQAGLAAGAGAFRVLDARA